MAGERIPVLLAGLAVFLVLAEAGLGATLQGSVYAWESLETLNNVIVEVDTAPPQRVVSRDGFYRLELPPGTYRLSAEYFEGSALKYKSAETVRVKDEGTFVLDLVLFPALEEELAGLDEPAGFDVDAPLQIDFGVEPFPEPLTEEQLAEVRWILFLFAVFVLVAVYLWEEKRLQRFLGRERHRLEREEFSRGMEANRAHLLPFAGPGQTHLEQAEGERPGRKDNGGSRERKGAAGDNVERGARGGTAGLGRGTRERGPESGQEVDGEGESLAFGIRERGQESGGGGAALELDKYALEVLDILRRGGNRLTQKELRERLPSIGEAKVSLIVSELVAAGKVKKIKQGRGNIVVLR